MMYRTYPAVERSEQDRGSSDTCAFQSSFHLQHQPDSKPLANTCASGPSSTSTSSTSSAGGHEKAEGADIRRVFHSTIPLAGTSQAALMAGYGVVGEPQSILKHALSCNASSSSLAANKLKRSPSSVQRLRFRFQNEEPLPEGAEASCGRWHRQPSAPTLCSESAASLATQPHSDPGTFASRLSLDDVRATSSSTPYARSMSVSAGSRPFTNSTLIHPTINESSVWQTGLKTTPPRVNFKLPPSHPGPCTLGEFRVWPQDELALRLEWPTDLMGYNQPQNQEPEGSHRKSKKKRSKSSFQSGGASDDRASAWSASDTSCISLVHYRLFNNGDASSQGSADDKKEARPAVQDKESEPILCCSSCQAPSWSTESHRYEAPIQVMYGDTLETPVWEACTPDMVGDGVEKRRKRGEEWYLHHLRSGYRTRLKSEDINDDSWSMTDREGHNWMMRASSTEHVLAVIERGRPTRCATFDAVDRSLHIELKPNRTSFRDAKASPMDVAFVLCCFEAVQAIRDEQASRGGRGRRDEIGRLLPKTHALKHLIQRFMGI
ncbi:hypothetical protein CF327_g268 [Tilletia walkeri]|nr:hypothetical protein CF327_g268 [Tilletia walkeri]